jgi:hypothetical protein
MVIRTIDAPALGFQPTETGIESTAQGARRVGAFYSQTAEDFTNTGSRIAGAVREAGDVYVKHLDHEQISEGAKDFAQRQLDLTQKWTDIAKDPAAANDPAVAQKFRDEVLEPSLDAFKGKFTTQRAQQWAEEHADALRNHMFQKTAADQSTLAGEAVKTNIAKVANSSAATARLDPSSLDFQLQTVESALKGVVESSPTLNAEQVARVSGEVLQKAKEGVVKSAVIGMIEKNPNVDLSKIEKKYSDFISGPEMQMFQKAAQVQARKDALLERQTQLIAKQQAELKAHADANRNFSDNVTIDPQTHRPIIKPEFFNGALDIAKNNPDAPNAQTTARTQLDWGEHQQNLKDESPRTDPAVKQDFVDRMFSTDHPTTEIELMRANVNGQLNHNDFNAMHQMVKTLEQEPLKGPIWHDTMEAVKADLMVSGINLPGKDVAGIKNYASFAQTFVQQYLAAARQPGGVPPNALDLKDPQSMISKAMAPFKRTVAQKMQDYMAGIGGAPGAPGNLTAPGTTITGVKVENQPAVRTKAEYDKLPSGSSFIDQNGKTWRKP